MKIDVLADGPTTIAVRIMPLASALETYGIKCKVILPIPWCYVAKEKLGHILSIVLTHPLREYIKMLKDLPNIIINTGLSTPQIHLLQKLLRSRNVKVIFDLDDAVFLPTGRLFGINIRPGSFALEKILRDVDFVTVNGHYLLGYVRSFNKKTAIIHDPIDCTLFSPRPKSRSRSVTIGWEGNPRAHYENLAMLLKPLERLSREFDLRFKIVSYLGDLRVKRMFEKFEKSIEIDYGSNHWLSLKDFAKCMSGFDIMAAPLQKTTWYEGKSALRVGIGMAMGVPVVASPVGEQKYVIKHGFNGFLARNEEEWYTYLKDLIESGKLRESMGRKGRAIAERELSIDTSSEKLYEIIKKLE